MLEPNKIPAKYYQLALLNVALALALYKGLSTLHLLSSLAFVAALTAPVALYFGFISRQTVSIVHEEIEAKLRQLCASGLSCLGTLQQADGAKRTRLLIYTLLLVYCSINFLCPCLQTLLLFNLAFAYLFMQEEVERAQHLLCSACEGCGVSQ